MKNIFKKTFMALLVGVMIIGVAGCGAKDDEDSGKFTPGTYTGEADGYGGKITATVEVTKDEIKDIKVDAPDETDGIGNKAVEIIAGKIVETQSLDVDTVGGATTSSKGVLEAIENALEKAGANIEDLKSAADKDEDKEDAKKEDLDTDIVIIGAGGAGMAAAAEAHDAGKSVIVIEKMPIVGGNTIRATGGMNAAETKYQEEGLDTKETFYEDTMKGGKDVNNPDLLHTMVDNAAESLEWLNDMGAGLTRVTLSGGATNPRIHTPEDGSAVGPVVVKVLSEKLEKDGATMMLETKAKELLLEDGVVVGVLVEDADGSEFKINSKAVILATGGFGANSEMVESYREDLVGFSTTNHAGAVGDGIVLAENAGADLTDIKEIQIHPTTDKETGYMFTEGLRGDGAILVNAEGERFTGELLTRDVVSANILKETDGIAYLITNEKIKEENAALVKYIDSGYTVEGSTIEDLAEELAMDKEVLKATLVRYGELVEKGVDEDFERENLTEGLEEGPYYALKVTPGIHHTMGGVKIDTDTHVIDKEGNVIKGLYAAGEVVGGVHGANRIGGNAVTDIIVFGRIAGKTSAAEIK